MIYDTDKMTSERLLDKYPLDSFRPQLVLPSEIDPNPYHVSPNEFFRLTQVMGLQLVRYLAETSTKLDGFIAIPRGGLTVTENIARMLSFDATHVYSASLTSYDPQKPGYKLTKERLYELEQQGHTIRDEFLLGQMPTREQVEGKTLFAGDDCVDTGRSLKVLHEIVVDELGAKRLITGGVYYKQKCRPPDVWGDSSHTGWLFFPTLFFDQYFNKETASDHPSFERIMQSAARLLMMDGVVIV